MTGDKVIRTVNNHDKEVFNDDIGTVTAIDVEEGEQMIRFDEREVNYPISELDEVSLAYIYATPPCDQGFGFYGRSSNRRHPAGPDHPAL